MRILRHQNPSASITGMDSNRKNIKRFLNTNESEYFLFLLHFIQRANKILHNSPQVTMHLQNAQDNLLPLLDLFTYAIREIILTEILTDLICS